MPKLNYIFLPFIFLCLSITSKAQEKTRNSNPDITIHIYDGIIFREDLVFWIDIQRVSDQVKITYKILDGINMSAFKNDTIYQALQKKFKNDAPADTNTDRLTKQLMRSFEQYKTYYRDSILLAPKSYTAFNKLLTKIAKASQEELDKGKLSRIIDGEFTNCRIISQGQTRSVNGSEPLSRTRPLIYHLIKHTLDLARDEKHPTILKIHQKFGY